MPTPRFALVASLAVAVAASVALAQPRAPATGSGDYRVGDRLPAPAQQGGRAAAREITWDALMPKGWDPMADFRELKLESLQDGDPRATKALEKLQEAWSKAPVEPAMDGQRVRIPGFVVPLDVDREEIREFLLVPFFGACIHTPPPPSNQIIHVSASKPVKGIRSMDAVWIEGTLRTTRRETGMGAAGYAMATDSVAPYKR